MLAEPVMMAISPEDMIAARMPTMTIPLIPDGNVMRIRFVMTLVPAGRSGIRSLVAMPS